jgi:TonB family protein
MSVLVAIGLALAATSPSAPGVEDEITVIARKLGLIRYSLSVSKQGQIQSCTITQSSGDAELDPMLCNALQACNSKFPFSRKNKKLLPLCLKQEMGWRQNELAEARERKNAQH